MMRKDRIMRDMLFDRDYQDGRDALHGGIDRLVATTMEGFRTLQAIQFDAPWRRESAVRGGNARAA
jgi:hypothetical protein